MNRRGFLGRTLRTLAAGAAAVVAAPTVMKAATADAAAPVVVSHDEKGHDVALSEVWGVNEDGDRTYTYEVDGQKRTIVGRVHKVQRVSGHDDIYDRSWLSDVAFDEDDGPVAAYGLIDNSPNYVNSREQALEMNLSAVQAHAARWCKGYGCSLRVERVFEAKFARVMHMVDGERDGGFETSAHEPVAEQVRDTREFLLWLATQHGPLTPAISPNIQYLMDVLKGDGQAVSAGGNPHEHGGSLASQFANDGIWGGRTS